MPATITACTDLRSPCPFVAKVEVYRWEENFGVTVDWWPCTTPLKEAFGSAERALPAAGFPVRIATCVAALHQDLGKPMIFGRVP